LLEITRPFRTFSDACRLTLPRAQPALCSARRADASVSPLSLGTLQTRSGGATGAYITALPEESTAAHNDDDAHDTDVRSRPTKSMAFSVQVLPL
jgi:hypothetical protein